MKVQKLLKNVARQAQKVSRNCEKRAQKIITKACMNERSRIKKQIAFKSSGKRGVRSQPGERPRTVAGKLNRMMRVAIYPTASGDAVVTIQMRWRRPHPAAIKRRLWQALPPERRAENRLEDRREIDRKVSEIMRIYQGKSPAIALDRGFGNTAARPFLKWIRETVKINMRNAIDKAAKQIGHIEAKRKK